MKLQTRRKLPVDTHTKIVDALAGNVNAHVCLHGRKDLGKLKKVTAFAARPVENPYGVFFRNEACKRDGLDKVIAAPDADQTGVRTVFFRSSAKVRVALFDFHFSHNELIDFRMKRI
jgi:hypothetical protein